MVRHSGLEKKKVQQICEKQIDSFLNTLHIGKTTTRTCFALDLVHSSILNSHLRKPCKRVKSSVKIEFSLDICSSGIMSGKNAVDLSNLLCMKVQTSHVNLQQLPK